MPANQLGAAALDVRAYYEEAAMALAGHVPATRQAESWFFRSTESGALLRRAPRQSAPLTDPVRRGSPWCRSVTGLDGHFTLPLSRSTFNPGRNGPLRVACNLAPGCGAHVDESDIASRTLVFVVSDGCRLRGSRAVRFGVD